MPNTGITSASLIADSAGNGNLMLPYGAFSTDSNGTTYSQRTFQINAYGTVLTTTYSFNYGTITPAPTVAPNPPAGTLITQFCSQTTLVGTYADGNGGTYNGNIEFLSPTCGYRTPAGTLISQFCSQTTLVGIYADGNGGTYNSNIEFLSPTCGYTPPPPASVTDFHVSPNPTNYGDSLSVTITAANLKANQGYTIATFYKDPSNGFNYLYTFPGSGFNSDAAGNLNATHASSALLNGYNNGLTVYIAEGAYSATQMQDVNASGIASSIVLQAQTPLTINFVDPGPTTPPSGGTDGSV